MSTRKQHDKSIMDYCYKYIEGMPKYMKSYVNALYAQGMNPTTIRTNLSYVKNFIQYLVDENIIENADKMENFNAVKQMYLADYLVSLQKTEKAKAVTMYGIKTFFKFMADNEFIDKNVFATFKIKKSKETKPITYLTKGEVKKIFHHLLKVCEAESVDDLDFLDLRDYVIIALGINTGMRKSSMAQIELKDIDFEDQTISIIQKGNKPLTLDIGDETFKLLHKYIDKRKEYLDAKGKSTDTLLVSQIGTGISDRQINNIIKKWTEDVIPGKKISPHKLRSTCATLLYSKTGDIYLTADRLGHASTDTTKRYAAIVDKKKKGAANLIDDIY